MPKPKLLSQKHIIEGTQMEGAGREKGVGCHREDSYVRDRVTKRSGGIFLA